MKGTIKKTLLLFAFAVVFSGIGFGQNARVDSIAKNLSGLGDVQLAEAYLELAKEYLYISPLKTIEFGKLALRISLDQGDEAGESSANLLIGAGHLFTGNFEEGREFSEKGLDAAYKLDNAENISIGLNSMAVYYMNVGDYDTAIEYFEESLDKAEEAGLEDRAASVRFNLGSIYTNKGERTKGLKYLSEALKYFEKKGDTKITTRIYNNIAVNYHSWGMYDEALTYYQQAYKMYSDSNDIVGKVVVLNNIAEIHKDQSQFDKAIKIFGDIIEIADSADIGGYYKAFGWVGLAESYILLKDYAKARLNAQKALKVFEETSMQEGIGNSKLVLAQVYLHEENFYEALLLCEACIEIGKNTGIKELLQRSYLVKSKVFEKSNQFELALNAYRNYAQLSDTLYEEKHRTELAQLRAELDVNEKESEIELLQKDNEIKDLQITRQKSQTRFLIIGLGLLVVVFMLTLIYSKTRKKANELLQLMNKQIYDQHEELKRVNDTKDKFMSIIGHDLRNPIGAFKDVVSQLADYPEMFSDELRTQILNELRVEAESTYFLLDNLLSWAKSQKSSIKFEPDKVDLKSSINNNILLNSRFSEGKKIHLDADIQEGHYVYADQNMVNLILRNLISNAIKFTPEDGKIKVTTFENGEFVKVSIQDTGVGIPKKDLPRLFEEDNHITTYGTNHEKGSGLGLLLCKEFVDKNGGKIWVDSKVGEGTTFSFTLKKLPA
ncbi:tetratricopeptide repeat protein [Sunxiuqinia sp. A32]|uniref:tetratricopeptide repeat protein n=1 Tax=Sunxiuqinia sp. A32 TaxID=3461496 RepID=UPI00404643AB